jgi:hypothetical protein
MPAENTRMYQDRKKTSPQPLSEGEGQEPLTRKSLMKIIKVYPDNDVKIESSFQKSDFTHSNTSPHWTANYY